MMNRNRSRWLGAFVALLGAAVVTAGVPADALARDGDRGRNGHDRRSKVEDSRDRRGDRHDHRATSRRAAKRDDRRDHRADHAAHRRRDHRADHAAYRRGDHRHHAVHARGHRHVHRYVPSHRHAPRYARGVTVHDHRADFRCRACQKRFGDRQAFYGHVHHHHRVALWRIPFLLVRAGATWVFVG